MENCGEVNQKLKAIYIYIYIYYFKVARKFKVFAYYLFIFY